MNIPEDRIMETIEMNNTGLPLIGSCEGGDCGDECPVFNCKLYAVHGEYLEENNPDFYYYCDTCVDLDRANGFIVEEVES